MSWSSKTIPDSATFDDKKEGKIGRAKHSERPFNTVPILNSSVNADLANGVPLDAINVDDPNRSAKRRLRSASRAGLQGLRDLLKVFKSNAADDVSAAAPAPAMNAVDVSTPSRELSNVEARFSIDGGPSTPSDASSATKQKRKSLNLKRRSFLRSKSSLESMKIQGAEAALAQVEVTPPPMPINRRIEESKRMPTPPKPSLDTTWEAGSPLGHKPDPKEARAARRISLQSSIIKLKRTSIEGNRPSSTLPHTTDSRSTKTNDSNKQVLAPDRRQAWLSAPTQPLATTPRPHQTLPRQGAPVHLSTASTKTTNTSAPHFEVRLRRKHRRQHLWCRN